MHVVLEHIEFPLKGGSQLPPPFFISGIAAGFPSPAESYAEKGLDLNEFLVRHPAATFFVRAAGDSMENAGIHSGDILVVDRSVEARSGSVVVAVLDGEFTVKRLDINAGRASLSPENDRYRSISISEGSDFRVWGVVTAVIHRFCQQH